MPALLLQRDLGADAANVGNTFSSWDTCMTESYCKWPAIVGIIIGSLIVISIIWCCARCLCCGAECCCGCLSCFNRCCPSPRRKDGYQQTPPQHPPYSQYQSPAPPMYFGGGYNAPPQTATFAAPTKDGKYNEDALPAMPSWNNATSRRVEDEDVEMEKLNDQSAQQQSLLHSNGNGRYYNSPPKAYEEGDLGTTPAGPYHDYSQHQQYVASPTSTAAPSVYPPTYHTRPPSSVYDPHNNNPYAQSIAPSYRTAAPSIAGAPSQQMSGGSGRKPVQGSWREV